MGSFVFPFALADAAMNEMDELAVRVRSLINTHDGALAVAQVDFEGETRTQFDRDVANQLDALGSLARMLDADIDSVRTAIAHARWLEQLEALEEANNP